MFPPSFIYEEKITNGESEVIIAQPRDLFTAANLKKFEVPWGEKVPTAFFRGTATGGGVTALSNQRLRAAQISYTWNSTSDYPNLSGRMGSGILGSKSKASGGVVGHKEKVLKTAVGGGVGGEGSIEKNGDDAGGAARKGGGGRGVGGGGGEEGNTLGDATASSSAVQRSHSGDIEDDETIASLGMNGPGSAPSSSSSSGPGSGTGTGTGVMEDSYYPYLDAKITGWNIRDKKTAGGKMTYLRKNNFQFEGDRKKNFVEIYKQVRTVDQISGLYT